MYLLDYYYLKSIDRSIDLFGSFWIFLDLSIFLSFYLFIYLYISLFSPWCDKSAILFLYTPSTRKRKEGDEVR